MKEYILPLALSALLIISCESKTDKAIREMRAQQYADSILRDMASDTTGVYLSPIKITDSKMVPSESGTSRDIQLTYTNISKKAVIGIKFKWKGSNVFGDPAQMGGTMDPGIGGGWTDKSMKPGATTSSTWEIYSKDGRKVDKAWPIEVVYEDGTKWTL